MDYTRWGYLDCRVNWHPILGIGGFAGSNGHTRYMVHSTPYGAFQVPCECSSSFVLPLSFLAASLLHQHVCSPCLLTSATSTLCISQFQVHIQAGIQMASISMRGRCLCRGMHPCWFRLGSSRGSLGNGLCSEKERKILP